MWKWGIDPIQQTDLMVKSWSAKKGGKPIIEDKRNILKEEKPFSYKKTKDKKGLIYWNNKLVLIIKGNDFTKLEKKEMSHDAYAMQLFLAKLTGHFKHGNEK